MDDNTRRGFLTATLVGLTASAVADGGDQPGNKAEIEKAVAEAQQRAEERQMQDQAAYGKALITRYGPGVVEVIKETTIARTRAKLAEALIPQRGLEAAKTLLWDRMGDPFQFQLVDRSAHRLEYRVTRCPLAERMRQLDAAELGFAYYCAYDYGFCQGLNPAIKFTRTKTLMQGDDCCNHTYEVDVQ